MTFQSYIQQRGAAASTYKTYAEYCQARKKAGLQVMPRKLFNSLKKGK